MGHGKSSKPSDGLRLKFPHYGYLDMVDLQKKLLADKIGVTHLRLVIGTSMGCMQAWTWATEHPAGNLSRQAVQVCQLNMRDRLDSLHRNAPIQLAHTRPARPVSRCDEETQRSAPKPGGKCKP